jgi:DNA-binding NarL/FixJ family response regulator
VNSHERIRVLLADDHRILREALRMVLASECDVIGEAASGEAAVDMATQLRPHVVVLDVGMPGMGGLAAAHRISRDAPSCKVPVLSQYDDEEYVTEALGEAGAAAYLTRPTPRPNYWPRCAPCIRVAAILSHSSAPIVLGRLRNPGRLDCGGSVPLTRREREALRLIGEGATTKEVAQRRGISPKTAQVHRKNLKQKLDLRSTAAMVP